ncbi:MAG TPA: hypothetical protein VGR36_10450, partial [Candidatus Acidoferrales bacterium]|nr:hypothetical protein [Candidatus Acidoferrales bacterium]
MVTIESDLLVQFGASIHRSSLFSFPFSLFQAERVFFPLPRMAKKQKSPQPGTTDRRIDALLTLLAENAT